MVYISTVLPHFDIAMIRWLMGEKYVISHWCLFKEEDPWKFQHPINHAGALRNSIDVS